VKANHIPPNKRQRGYLMIEALVYIGLLFAILGVGYAALYRCIDSSLAVRRNADDITSALHAGERWRADIRATETLPRVERADDTALLSLHTARGDVAYKYESNAIFRRLNTNQWICVLTNVKWSAMNLDERKSVTAWRWEFELLPYFRNNSNPNRVHPIFSFGAVPQKASS
jgi:hypothetical protein